MGLVVSHKFISQKPDSLDLTLVNPTNWNALHAVADNSRSAFNIDYLFTLTPGGNLTGGISNTVTISPVPVGINGNDSKHVVYLSGGTGAGEAVLITGGNAVSGAASGTLTFTPANNHSGLWTITSATSGMAEAQQYLLTNFGGGQVTIVTGQWPIYGTTFFQDNMVFAGFGVASSLNPQSNNVIVFQGNVPTKATVEYTLNSDNIFFRDFTIDAIGLGNIQNNTGGIVGLNATNSIETWSYVNIQINNVDFNNVFSAVTFCRVYGLSILNCRLWFNSKIELRDSTTANSIAYFNANITIDKLWYNWHPMNNPAGVQVTMTNSIILLFNCETTKITDSFFAMRGGTTAAQGSVAITCLGGEDYYICRCVFVQVWSAIVIGSFTAGGPITLYASFITISECSVDGIWGPGIVVNPGTGSGANQQSDHIQIIGCEITDLIKNQGGLALFILLNSYTRQVLISNNVFRGLFGSTQQTGLDINSNVSDITFGQNLWDNESDSGDVSGIHPVGISLDPNSFRVYGLENNLFSAIGWGTNVSDAMDIVPSVANLFVVSNRRFVTVTGSTSVTSMIYNGMPNDIIRLLFPNAITIVKGGNLKLNSNFVTTGTATGTLTLMWDGTNMVELARSAN
jgi:hypothetical protein